MFFGQNLQLLRRRRAMTQEQLAQHLGVSRQTVSKWESGQAPELSKLMELSDLFHCPLDDLLRQDLSVSDAPVRLLRVKGFSMARYVMISPNAQADIRTYLDNWAKNSGLADFPGRQAQYLSWGFPYISAEQKQRFHLKGFAAAYVLPEQFHPNTAGPEITYQDDCDYARITFPEPRGRDSHQISRAIQSILEYLRENGIAKTSLTEYLPCFEWRYEQDGTPYASVFLQCQGAGAEEVFTFDNYGIKENHAWPNS